MSEVEFTGQGMTNPPTISGKGTVVGVGYNIFKNISVNLEHYMNTWDDNVDFEGGGQDQTPFGTNEDSATFVSLSFPFGL